MLAPLGADLAVTIRDLDAAVYQPYLPVSARLEGRVGAEVESRLRTDGGSWTAEVRGRMWAADLALWAPTAQASALRVERLEVEGMDVAWPGRARAARVKIKGPVGEVERAADGSINVPALRGVEVVRPGPARPGSTAARAAVAPPLAIEVGELEIEDGYAAVRDLVARPPFAGDISALTASVTGLSTERGRPMRFSIRAGLPGGAAAEMRGSATLDPLGADVTVSVRDLALEAYGSYVPLPARLEGRLGAEVETRLRAGGGPWTAEVRGRVWAADLALWAPTADTSTLRIERLEVEGIDAAWPGRARAARVRLKSPVAEVERSPDGTIDLKALLTPTQPVTTGSAAGTPGPPRRWLDGVDVQVGEIVVEDGYARFLDRTTRPAFSEDLSGLSLTLTGLGSRPGQRAALVLTSTVGGDSELDLRGELSPLGAEPYADIVGEIRRFALPSVNPYAESWLAWIVRRGELTARVRYRLERDVLTGENLVVVGKLQVSPSGGEDEVRRRIGLPLDVLVALIKDSRGEIRLNVPVSGTLTDRRFHLGEAMWTAVRNAIVSLLAAPLRLVGRLFTREERIEDLAVDPVTFAAGSSVVSPAMERHLTRVADFLRRAPYVRLVLHPVATTADVDTLRHQEVLRRLEALQKERNLPDLPSALGLHYRERLPGVVPPRTTEEQLRLLHQREPAPVRAVKELLERRAQATRDRLVRREGIQPERLALAEARPPGGDGEGRVEFEIAPDQD
jgi:hypothetical protein